MVVTDQLAFDLERVQPVAARRCARCRAELTAGDLRQNRVHCGPCRREIALEHDAERDYLTAPRPARCRCERPVLVDGCDGPQCLLCGRLAA